MAWRQAMRPAPRGQFVAKKKFKKNGSPGKRHADASARHSHGSPAFLPPPVAEVSAADGLALVALNQAEPVSRAAVAAELAVAVAVPAGMLVDDPLAGVFTALELDFFRRAEDLYATSFDQWEDFDREPN